MIRVLIAVFALLAWTALASAGTTPAKVAATPKLEVTTIDKEKFTLAAQRGKWVVVNFWATWCGPCLKEMPDLSQLDEKRDDVVVIGLAFEEITVALRRPDTARRIRSYSPSGKVPVLLAGDQCIWDSLAICEYAAELAPELWPADAAARAEARAVKIYYSGEQPECLEVLRLGRVQAKAGDFPDPDPQFISPQVHMDVALAWLRVEAANKGANGVILLEQKGNHDGTLHIAIGEAIFCRVAN